MSLCSDAPEDEVISLFAGFLPNPDVPLSPEVLLVHWTSSHDETNLFYPPALDLYRRTYDTVEGHVLGLRCAFSPGEDSFVFQDAEDSGLIPHWWEDRYVIRSQSPKSLLCYFFPWLDLQDSPVDTECPVSPKVYHSLPRCTRTSILESLTVPDLHVSVVSIGGEDFPEITSVWFLLFRDSVDPDVRRERVRVCL